MRNIPNLRIMRTTVTFLQMGGEAGVTNPQLEKMKTVFRAFSILLIPVTAQFPTVRFLLILFQMYCYICMYTMMYWSTVYWESVILCFRLSYPV